MEHLLRCTRKSASARVHIDSWDIQWHARATGGCISGDRDDCRVAVPLGDSYRRDRWRILSGARSEHGQIAAGIAVEPADVDDPPRVMSRTHSQRLHRSPQHRLRPRQPSLMNPKEPDFDGCSVTCLCPFTTKRHVAFEELWSDQLKTDPGTGKRRPEMNRRNIMKQR